LSVFKKLAGEAAWYGLSSIIARMVNFILVPLHTTIFVDRADYGEIGQLYGWIALAVLIYSFRLEAAYFRYASQDKEDTSYRYSKTLTLCLVLLGSVSILFFYQTIANWLDIKYAKLILFAGAIVGLDALAELPFARLRMEKRPIRFATIKSISILINVFFNFYFLYWAPSLGWPHPEQAIASVFWANVLGSLVTLGFLYKEYLYQGFAWNQVELGKIIRYSWPLVIVALAGVIDDAMSRQFIYWLAPGDAVQKKLWMGEYNACVKFAVFITLFVQAFRYAAEPFFFRHMHHQDAKKDYSQITTYFTQFLMIGYVAILLYIDFFQGWIIRNPAYLQAMPVVPIVLLANVFLGIYYNISNWYRLTDRTEYGLYTALIGMGVTIFFNYILVPRIGYYGTAWTLLLCYGIMTLTSFLWGQKFYPVDFDIRKILLAISSGVLVYLLAVNLQGYLAWSGWKFFCLRSGLFLFYLIVFNRPLLKLFLPTPKART
jgi:O-antigen/teichoic acid export membrane protein